MEFMKKLQI